METFSFIYFRFATRYPDSTTVFQFGRSYSFAVPPPAPDQRNFLLTFPNMFYYETTPGSGVLDISFDGVNNMGNLEDFYSRHKLFQSFNWTHPAHGSLVCRFAKPIEVPEGKPGGFGALESFTVELVEQP